LALYERIGRGYGRFRRPDPRIEAFIVRALGDARSVVNVGAGTGSYEPSDCQVVAVEPAWAMIAQRPADAAPVVRGSATALPFTNDSFDAALAILTLHHWPDWQAGVRELARVARQRVVLLTFEPGTPFWIMDYFPEIGATDREICPTIADLTRELRPSSVVAVPIFHDCTDGFLGAYWRHPEAYLDPAVRKAISAFDRIGDIAPGLARLRRDLESGEWLRRYQGLLTHDSLDLGYRLITAPVDRPGCP
jgi:SAM-dependent methyltransferase